MQQLKKLLTIALLLACSPIAVAQDNVTWHFDAKGISRPVLENYLKRSITMTEVLTVDPFGVDGPYSAKDDDLRLIKNIGAKFIGRAVYRWGNEQILNDMAFLAEAKKLAEKIHAGDPDIVLQAALFEIVTPRVNEIKVPAWAFEALEVPEENRNFNYEAMLNEKGKFVNHWGRSSVPDISRPETQLWFIFLAGTYLDLGCEAFHLGQTSLMGMNDPKFEHWAAFLKKLRTFSQTRARRGWVILDAHTPHGGMVVDGVSLLDFNSFPLRIKEIPDKPQECVLEMGYLDALFGRSLGCVSPSGWSCGSLPYLVEFDNFGVTRNPGQSTIDSHYVWGYDEISWFYLQSEQYRNEWLKYAWHWVREHDPNGFLQMPVSRVVSLGQGKRTKFRANTKSGILPEGLNLEATIKEIWQAL